MALPVFKTQYNSEPVLGFGQTQESMTIPDDTLTPSQLLRKYTYGLPLDTVVYDESQEADPNGIDFTDFLPNANQTYYKDGQTQSYPKSRSGHVNDAPQMDSRQVSQAVVTKEAGISAAPVPTAPVKE